MKKDYEFEKDFSIEEEDVPVVLEEQKEIVKEVIVEKPIEKKLSEDLVVFKVTPGELILIDKSGKYISVPKSKYGNKKIGQTIKL